MCDELSQRISSNPNERYLLRDYLEYIERASSEILNFCGTVTKELEKEEKYTSRYFDIDFDIPERLFVFVSGKPDTGKTTFSNILSSRIRNAIHLDSDVLLERGQLCQPILGLVPDDIKVVVFSDIYAHRFFSQEELGNARVINILIEPISIEAMHRNSKFMSHIPFEDYKKYEIDKINYDSLDNSITVTNRYTGQMDAEVDTALEEIASRLGKILKSTEQSESTPTPLKRVLKPASLHEKK